MSNNKKKNAKSILNTSLIYQPSGPYQNQSPVLYNNVTVSSDGIDTTWIKGQLLSPNQSNITTIGNLTSLTVQGNSNLQGNLNIDKNETIKGNLQIDGYTLFNGNLYLSNSSYINSNVNIKGNLDVNGNIFGNIQGNISTYNLNLPGNIEANGFIQSNSYVLSNTLIVTNTSNLQGGLITTSINSSSIYTSGTANIQGGLTSSSLLISGSTSLQGLTTSDLLVSGTTSLQGTIIDNLLVSGTTSLQGLTSSNLLVSGTTNLQGTTINDLLVSGTTSLQGLTSSNLLVSGTTSLQGLTTTSIDASSIYTSGTSNIQGGLTASNLLISGTTNLQGIVSINNTTTSTSTSTGALQVLGGVGVGDILNVNGNINSNGNLYVYENTSIRGYLFAGSSVEAAIVPLYVDPFSKTVHMGSSSVGTERLNVQGNIYVTDKVKIVGTTDSTSVSTGSLIVNSGVGIGGNLNLGGYANIIGSSNLQGGLITTSINASSIYSSGTANIQGELTTNGIYNSNTTTLQGALTVNNSTTISGVTTITNTNNSTSVNSGALIVQGGLGLSNNMKNTGTIYSQQLEIGSVLGENYSTTIVDSSGVGIVTTDQLIASSSVTTGKLITTNIEPPSGSNLAITSNGQTLNIGTLSDIINIKGSITITGTVTSANVTNLDVSNSQIFLNTGGTGATPPAGSGIYVEGLLGNGDVYPNLALNSNGQWIIQNLDKSTYNVANISNIVANVNNYVKINAPNVDVYAQNLNINPTTGGTQGNLQILTGNLVLGGTSNTLNANSTTGNLTTIGNIVINNSTNATSTSTGSFQTLGGAAIGQNLYVGNQLNLTNSGSNIIYSAGEANIRGGLTTTSIYGNSGFITGNFSAGQSSLGTGVPLYVESTNKRLFIGTTSGGNNSEKLYVLGDSNITGASNLQGGLTTTSIYGTSANITGTTNLQGLATIGSMSVTGTTNLTGALTATSINASSIYTIGTANIQGGISAGNSNIALNGNLSIEFQSNVSSNVSFIDFHSQTNNVVDRDARIAVSTSATSTSVNTGTLYVEASTIDLGTSSYKASLNIFGSTNISNTTVSTSTSSGALQVAGGVGIGGNLYIGGSATLAGSLIHSGSASFTGILSLSNTTSSTSTSTGALQVAGGQGLTGNLSIGGNLISTTSNLYIKSSNSSNIANFTNITPSSPTSSLTNNVSYTGTSQPTSYSNIGTVTFNSTGFYNITANIEQKLNINFDNFTVDTSATKITINSLTLQLVNSSNVTISSQTTTIGTQYSTNISSGTYTVYIGPTNFNLNFPITDISSNYTLQAKVSLTVNQVNINYVNFNYLYNATGGSSTSSLNVTLNNYSYNSSNYTGKILTGNIQSLGSINAAQYSTYGTYLELNSASNTSYLDFHCQDNYPTDYDARIISSGGNSNISASGTANLDINCANVNVSSNLYVNTNLYVNSKLTFQTRAWVYFIWNGTSVSQNSFGLTVSRNTSGSTGITGSYTLTFQSGYAPSSLPYLINGTASNSSTFSNVIQLTISPFAVTTSSFGIGITDPTNNTATDPTYYCAISVIY